MKKIIAILFFASVTFSNNVSAQELAVRLAQNQCFVKLIDNFDIVLNVTKQNTSVINISAEDFNSSQDKDAYLSDVTGLPLETVKNINQDIKGCFTNIKDSIPELDQLTKNEMETVFSEAVNIVERTAGGEIGGGSGGDPCADCKRAGRRNMIGNTFFGIIACPWHIWTSWACGTYGFYLAAQATLECLRANNCK